MIRSILIFIIVCLMVVSAHADPRWAGHGGGWGGHPGGWGGGEHHWGGGGYYHRYDPGTAFWGGVVGGWIGSVFAPRPEPEVVVVPQQPVAPSIEWCIQRYRSYNPNTRTYLGYDGQFHGCP